MSGRTLLETRRVPPSYGTFPSSSIAKTKEVEHIRPVAQRAIQKVEKLPEATGRLWNKGSVVLLGVFGLTIGLPLTLLFLKKDKIHSQESSFVHALSKSNYFLLMGVAKLIFYVITLKFLWGPVVCLFDSRRKQLSRLQNELAEQQFNAMKRAALECHTLVQGIRENGKDPVVALALPCMQLLTGNDKKVKPEEIIDFIYSVLQIKSDLLTMKKDHSNLLRFYQRMDMILMDPLYKEIIEVLKDPESRRYLKSITGKESIAAIDFLHEVVRASYLDGQSGERAYEEFGRASIKDELGAKKESSCGEMADIFLRGIDRLPWYYKMKPFDGVNPQSETAGKAKKLWLIVNWTLSDLSRSYRSLEGYLFPLTYNSYRGGNQNVPLWDYDKTVCVTAAPGQTSGRGMDCTMILQRLQSGRILYHNLQSPAVRGERQRYAQLLLTREKVHGEVSKKSDFHLFSTPSDGAFLSSFTDWTDVDDFFGKFWNYACTGDYKRELEEGEIPAFAIVDAERMEEDNGFFIPSDVLSEEEVKKAFDTTQTFMKKLATSEYWQSLDRKRRSQMMQMATNSVIALRAIQKAKNFKTVTPEEALRWEQEVSDRMEQEFILLMQSCKQCVDRGPMMLLMTKIFFDISRGKGWNEASVACMTGFLLGRPMQVDGRVVSARRFQPFYDVLKMIADQESLVREALDPQAQ